MNPPTLIRLNKFIADAGIASRRKADELIAAGKVKVNDGLMISLGTKINPDVDLVSVNGKQIKLETELAYYLINKPRGVLSTTSDPGRGRTVIDLVKTNKRLFPVGRLDQDSEGLMLLTNDGTLAYRLTHPKFKITKTYHVLINGQFTGKALLRLRSGVKTKHGTAKADSARIISSDSDQTWLEISLHGGKKHEIRLMLSGLGYTVNRLIRTSLGPFQLTDLKEKTALQLTVEKVSAILR